jgi:hypothetical protein
MNGKFHFFVFLILFFSLQGDAQYSKVPVQFKAGDFYLENNILNNSFSYAQIERSLSGEYYFVLLQFVSLPDASTKKNMEAAGITLGNFYANNAFLARIEKNTDFKNLNRFKINAIAAVPSHYKIDPALYGFIDKKNRSEQFLIELEYFHGISREEVIKKIISLGAQVSTTHFDAAGKIFIQYNRLLIDSVANMPFISSLQLQNIKDKALNYQSKNTHGVNALQSVFGKNLKGNNVVIGIGDNADISVHTDFTGRLINRSPWIPDNHGTHVAGTAGGAGIINVKNMGMAPKATLINQYFSDIITNAPVYAKDYNMVVSNNSYYSSQAGCPGDGEYDAMSSYVDVQVNTNKQLLHMIAAGNDGSLTCSPYPAAFGTIKTGWQCAKNVLTVGAINAQNYGIASFSSRGPVKDGRIKPEIVTNGWGLLSTISNNSYGFDYGTSMSSPVVTGAVALLYERYRQLNAGQDPTGTLMKAVVCNTAEDLGNKGPDFTFGFGMLQARRAMETIESSRYIIGTVSNGNNNTHNITLPSNARYLKVMLHWNDPVAAVNAAKSLVNDLDLKVTNPAAQIILPYVLNPAAAAVNSLATNSADHTNNIEQVVITNPAAGNYTFTINGFSVPQGPQEYVVTYDIIYEGITIEHPFGGDKLVPGETETIRWSAF